MSIELNTTFIHTILSTGFTKTFGTNCDIFDIYVVLSITARDPYGLKLLIFWKPMVQNVFRLASTVIALRNSTTRSIVTHNYRKNIWKNCSLIHETSERKTQLPARTFHKGTAATARRLLPGDVTEAKRASQFYIPLRWPGIGV